MKMEFEELRRFEVKKAKRRRKKSSILALSSQ